jgi:hypothetical protein
MWDRSYGRGCVAVARSRLASDICLALSVRATTNRRHVEILTEAALRLGVRARSAMSSMRVVCGGVEPKIPLRWYRRAERACLRPLPFLSYPLSVMMSRPSSEP